jgi:hypothetical protein
MSQEQNYYAVVEDKRELFQTTPLMMKEKTMKEVISTNPTQDYFSVKYAEAYDAAEWFKARCEYLEKREEGLREMSVKLTEHRWNMWKENQEMKAKLAYLEENNYLVFREVETYGKPAKIEGMPADPVYGYEDSESDEQDTDGSDEDLNGAISVSGSAF